MGRFSKNANGNICKIGYLVARIAKKKLSTKRNVHILANAGKDRAISAEDTIIILYGGE